jgi:hypothetical protein
MHDTLNHHVPHRLDSLGALLVSELNVYEVPVPSILGPSFGVRACCRCLGVTSSRALEAKPHSLTRLKASQGILVTLLILFIFSSRN